MSANQYLLQWNHHLENFAENFSMLRDQSQYVDCTLACEDGAISAHRIVLAGCSSYLQELFSRTATSHPVIFLTNTHRSIVLLLLEFIYRGKTYVPQEKLGALLELGRQLRVKGLIRVDSPNIEALVGKITENLSRATSRISNVAPAQETTLTTPLAQRSPQEPEHSVELSENGVWTDPMPLKEERIVEDSDETMSVLNGDAEQLESDLQSEVALTSQQVEIKPKRRGRPPVNNNYYMRIKGKHVRTKSRLGDSTGYCLTSLDILTLGGYSKKFGTEEAIHFAWKKHKRNFRPATILRYEGLFTLTAEKKRLKIENTLNELKLQ